MVSVPATGGCCAAHGVGLPLQDDDTGDDAREQLLPSSVFMCGIPRPSRKMRDPEISEKAEGLTEQNIAWGGPLNEDKPTRHHASVKKIWCQLPSADLKGAVNFPPAEIIISCPAVEAKCDLLVIGNPSGFDSAGGEKYMSGVRSTISRTSKETSRMMAAARPACKEQKKT